MMSTATRRSSRAPAARAIVRIAFATAALAADHPAEVVVGDLDLEHELAALLVLLHLDLVGALDDRTDQEVDELGGGRGHEALGARGLDALGAKQAGDGGVGWAPCSSQC